MAMKGLLDKLNKIQDLFSTLRYEPIELPKIVVVGTQSAGKSSVLESLVAIGDQPEDIEEQIQELIMDYIENPLTIILAVVTANTDMATNESLKLAKSVDPEGERTLAVLTKVDLMDEGTDARDMLKGLVIPVKLGIVGVINRSQKDINDNKTMEDAFKYEQEYFQKKYKEIASRTGSLYLAKKLSMLLSDHINKNLPDVENKIRKEMEDCSKILDECGESITDKRATLMNVVNKFSQAFCSLCDKGSQNLQSMKLTGGAKLCDILHSSLEKVFARCEPCKSYTTDQVIIAIRQSNGLKPPFFVSEVAFETLIKPLIKKMEKPALACVDAVKRELGNMCQLSISGQLQLRFPELTQALIKVVLGIVEERSQKAIQTIKDLVSIETGHITYYRINVLEEEFQEVMKQDKIDSSLIPFKEGVLEEKLRSRSRGAGKEEKADIDDQLNLLTMSEKDKKHVIILGKMLDHYYQIVAETMQDSTAKAVVTFLVNEVRESLTTELSVALMQRELDELFHEQEDITDKREATHAKLNVLEQSLQVISGITSHQGRRKRSAAGASPPPTFSLKSAILSSKEG
ncbi:dynamin-1-like protein isoform X2 [Thrips palmi]|uniref:Dynamin-1-like protein isoform X2 n=1 Tax=Thrips palmi TaxID=161013 RepID=A0A6P8XVR6_THRPL|nr:dynamin-1-like protein isoform X2 [Thrips palmi]